MSLPASSVRSVAVSALILTALSARPAALAADAPTGAVTALRFTTDHQLICKNSRDVIHGGDRYPAVAWRRAPAVNAPITHTGSPNAYIGVQLALVLDHVGDDTPYLLRGISEEPALCFRKEGTLETAEQPMLRVEATKPLGFGVRKVRTKIDWSLTLFPGTKREQTLALGTTGPHVVYVTLGRPRNTDEERSVVTDARMDLAVRRVAAALKAADGETGGPWIVYWLMRQTGDYYQPTRHYSKEEAWRVPESWEMSPPGASCISIVEFVGLVCKMIGVEGTTWTTAYYAKPPNPRKALQGGLGDPPIRRREGNETWQLFLVDESNTNHGQAGGVGGMNYYEAVLLYELDGRKFYYPGGTGFVYESPDKVLRIFRTLAWAAWDERVRDWVVREVVETYTKPGEKRPRSMDLP